ncbi:unnamed protein product [Closterium sp. Yama58-4]|nr:unnamed protein product [Closterium sp. Yama58-4]
MSGSVESTGVGGQLQVSVVQGRHVRQPGEDGDATRGTVVSVQLGCHQIRTRSKAGPSPKWLQDFKLPVEAALLFCPSLPTESHPTPSSLNLPCISHHPPLQMELLSADQSTPAQSQFSTSASAASSGPAAGPCLGRASVPLAGLVGGATVVRWYQMTDEEGCLVGEICIVSRFLRLSSSGSSCSSGVWSAGQVLLGVAGALFGVALLSMVARRRQRRLALLHEVQKGETMCSIATRYCVNPERIIDANVAEGIDDPDVIFPGDVILIPPT